MTNSSITKQRLPSPPASLSGDYQPGIDQLLQHNAATQYRTEHYITEDSGYMHSGQSTAYGSPAGNNWLADQQSNDNQHNPYQQLEHGGLGINYVSPLLLAASA